DRFSLAGAIRDDDKVADIIADTKTVDSVHNLEEEAVLDRFMAYLSEMGVLGTFSTFSARRYQRVMIPFYFLLLTYFTKILLAIPSMKSLPSLLFSDQGVM